MHSLAEHLILPGSPFELMPRASHGPRLFRHLPSCVQALFGNGTRFGSRTCMVVNGSRVSFTQIAAEAAKLAVVLARRHGVRSGTRVAVVATGGPAWFAAVVSIWWAGGIAVIVDRRLPVDQRIAVLDRSGCGAAITDRDCSRELRARGDRRAHIPLRNQGEWARGGSFYDVEAQSGEDLQARSPAMSDPDEDALIAFTSGSTGTPKGVISTHRAILSGMFNSLLCAALAGARDRTRSGRVAGARGLPCSLLLSPFSHVGGYSHLILMTHLAGRVVPYDGTAAGAVATLAREGVTVLSGASSQFLKELVRTDAPSEALGSLSTVTVHGSTLATQLVLEMQSRFPTVQLTTGYGLTETNGLIASAAGTEILERAGSCGPLLPSVEVAIRDEAGSEVSTGRWGEVWVRGSMLMRGYLSPSDSNGLRASLRDGWFCTDDIGCVSSDGYLYVSERRQDLLRTSNGPISCARIAQDLCKIGMAEEAIALSDETPDHPIHLIMAIAPGSDESLHEKAGAWLQQVTSLGRDQITVLMLDRLPRTSSGKPDRPALRRLADARRSGQGAPPS